MSHLANADIKVAMSTLVTLLSRMFFCLAYCVIVVCMVAIWLRCVVAAGKPVTRAVAVVMGGPKFVRSRSKLDRRGDAKVKLGGSLGKTCTTFKVDSSYM